jgi:hypothetical protein
MFRALLAHPQEALHKRHLVYCVRVMSVGCTWCTLILLKIQLLRAIGEISRRFRDRIGFFCRFKQSLLFFSTSAA